MAYYHRKHDPQFAEQWEEARDHGIEMLHARVFQRCLEGDLEPVMYMGVAVGWIRKFDSKLQIEMLRTYKPDRYKTPGTNVNVGTKGDVFVLTEEQRREMQAITKERITSFPKDPVEWDKYLEEHSFNPNRARARLHNANELEDEFRCIQCFKLLPRTHLNIDGQRCQQCADLPAPPPTPGAPQKNSLG
jgi:hypothetical protein